MLPSRLSLFRGLNVLLLFYADDHSRVKLKAEINPSRTDYINASTIVRLNQITLVSGHFGQPRHIFLQ